MRSGGILKTAVWVLDILEAHKKHINVAQLHSEISRKLAIYESEGGP